MPPQLLALRALRIFYFLNYGALGTLFPFLPMLLSARGLSPSEISWVMVLVPVFNLIIPPLWGSVADALRARIVLLRVAAFTTGLSVLLFLPRFQFWGSLFSLAVFGVFRAPLASLADAATVAALGEQETSYGRVRVWGSVGFAIFVVLVGQLQGSRHAVLLSCLSCLIYLLSGLTTLTIPVSPLQRRRGILRQTMKVLSRPEMRLFLLGSVSYYVGHAVFDTFFGLHLQRLGFDDGFTGIAWATGVVVEIVIMLLAPQIFARARTTHLLCLAAVASCLRWGLMAVARAWWIIVALQTLHGLTFGLWYLSLVRFMQAAAEERLRTSLQSAAAASYGFGSILGVLAGGAVYHRRGGAMAFAMAAVTSGLALLLYGLVALLDPTRGPRVETS